MLLYTYLHVHVWDTDQAVVRAAAGVLKTACRPDSALRHHRKGFYCDMLKAHRDHRLAVRFDARGVAVLERVMKCWPIQRVGDRAPA